VAAGGGPIAGGDGSLCLIEKAVYLALDAFAWHRTAQSSVV
jgi:hypothetical protein